MRKILLSAVALALSFCVIGVADMMAAAFTPVLYGNLIYTRTWGDEDATRAGVYRFNASDAISPARGISMPTAELCMPTGNIMCSHMCPTPARYRKILSIPTMPTRGL